MQFNKANKLSHYVFSSRSICYRDLMLVQVVENIEDENLCSVGFGSPDLMPKANKK